MCSHCYCVLALLFVSWSAGASDRRGSIVHEVTCLPRRFQWLLVGSLLSHCLRHVETLGQLWDNLQHGDNFRTTVGQLWDNIGTTLGQLSDNIGTTVGQHWDNFDFETLLTLPLMTVSWALFTGRLSYSCLTCIGDAKTQYVKRRGGS